MHERAARVQRIADEERARALLAAYGRSGTAYMTVWRKNRLFFSPGHVSYIGYRQETNVAIALGDPIGPREMLAPTITAFAAYCCAQGWTHAFHATTADALPMYTQMGYRAIKIGEEALVPLPGLVFKGKVWQDVRSALNRAAREDIRFCLYQGGTLPTPIRDQLFALSAQWLREKGTPEMGFTLGTVTDIDDPNIAVAVALSDTGKVLAFVDWLPMFAAHGYVLDLMRRAPAAPGGIMEFLIGSSLLRFKERGDQIASLATAPLANLSRAHDPSLVQRGLGYIYDHGESFSSLFAFKKKFQPRWEGVYLIYRHPTDLPRVCSTIVRAYVPNKTLNAVRATIGTVLVRRSGTS